MQSKIQRRKAIKNIALAGGAATVTVWTKPVIDSVLLPVHAATSEVAPAAEVLMVTSGAFAGAGAILNSDPQFGD